MSVSVEEEWISKAVIAAVDEGHFPAIGNEDDFAAALIYNSSRLWRTMDKLKQAFDGPHWLHCFAVKACPLTRVLHTARELGFGAEVASMGEFKLASQVCGFPGARIAFDSPCKSTIDLVAALDAGAYVNSDSFDELDRVSRALLSLSSAGSAAVPANVGLRLNPQLGSGRIEMTSTATAASKFGVPLVDQRSNILAAYMDHAFLNGVHVHVGSQGCSLDMLVQGVRRAVDFAHEVDAIRQAQGKPGKITWIDIGGGLPSNYSSDTDEPTFEEYAVALRASVPEIFDGSYFVLTEFGRSIVAKSGALANRVHCIKETAERRIAVVPVGGEMLCRTVYMPTTWILRVATLNADGSIKTLADNPINESSLQTDLQLGKLTDVAGPLCFGGDIIAHKRRLPPLQVGDWIVALDCGAYSISHYTVYCSRPIPQILAFAEQDDGTVKIERWRKEQSVTDLLKLFECDGTANSTAHE